MGRPHKIKDEHLDELLEEAAHYTLGQLAMLYGTSKATVSKAIRRAGGRARRGRPLQYDPSSFVEDRVDGRMSTAALATAYGMSIRGVQLALRRHHLTSRELKVAYPGWTVDRKERPPRIQSEGAKKESVAPNPNVPSWV